MRFTINQSEMKDLIKVACSIAEGTSATGFAGVLIEAEDDCIFVGATDERESSVRAAAALVSETGSTCVPARMLASIISSLPDCALEIFTKDSMLHIAYADNHLTLPTSGTCLPVDIELIEEGVSFDIASEKFVDALSRVSNFANKGELEYMPGVCLDCGDDGVLHVVATDSYRLGKVSFKDQHYPKLRAFLPFSFVKYLTVLKYYGAMRVVVSDTAACFSIGELALQTVLLKENFPAWQSVMALPESSSFSCDLASLKASVARAKAVGASNTELEFGAANVKVAGYGSDGSSNVEYVKAGKSDIEGLAASYVSTGLFRSVLGAIDGSEVTVEIYLSTKTLLLHGDTIDALIMPVRKPVK